MCISFLKITNCGFFAAPCAVKMQKSQILQKSLGFLIDSPVEFYKITDFEYFLTTSKSQILLSF
jgi:hypothetical protein